VKNGQLSLPWTMHTTDLPLDANADFHFQRVKFIKV
jgi:hypothetical protein